MARQTPRRRAWTVVGLVAAIVALSAAAWALHEWQPFAAEAEAVTWPDNIEPLAEFVEATTRLEFLEPVTVEFVDGDEFAERVAVEPRTQETLDTIAIDEAVGRALGFWRGDTDLVESADILRAASDSGVEWLLDEDVLVVRAADESSELSVLDRADLVLVLTEIVDDQHFDIARRLAEAGTAQEFQVLAALDIGQALWVRDRYVDDLDIDARRVYQEDRRRRAEETANDVDAVAPAFRALRTVGQAVGAAFVAAMHESDDHHALRDAFTRSVPAALDQMTLPVAKYERRDGLEGVVAPPVPRDATALYERQMGPFAVYMVLAGGLPPREALAAADGWGNDAFTAYRLDGRVCVDGRIEADSRSDADRIEAALDAWGTTRPEEADALVGRDGTSLLLSVCDPGDSTRQPTVTPSAIDEFLGRSALLQQRIELTGLPALSECVTTRFLEEHDASDVSEVTPDFDPFGQFDDITTACLDEV